MSVCLSVCPRRAGGREGRRGVPGPRLGKKGRSLRTAGLYSPGAARSLVEAAEGRQRGLLWGAVGPEGIVLLRSAAHKRLSARS